MGMLKKQLIMEERLEFFYAQCKTLFTAMGIKESSEAVALCYGVVDKINKNCKKKGITPKISFTQICDVHRSFLAGDSGPVEKQETPSYFG